MKMFIYSLGLCDMKPVHLNIEKGATPNIPRTQGAPYTIQLWDK